MCEMNKENKKMRWSDELHQKLDEIEVKLIAILAAGAPESDGDQAESRDDSGSAAGVGS